MRSGLQLVAWKNNLLKIFKGQSIHIVKNLEIIYSKQ